MRKTDTTYLSGKLYPKNAFAIKNYLSSNLNLKISPTSVASHER